MININNTSINRNVNVDPIGLVSYLFQMTMLILVVLDVLYRRWSRIGDIEYPDVGRDLITLICVVSHDFMENMGSIEICAICNNNVKLALEYMSEENMLIIKEDKSQTEKYYLGKMARVILGRIIPNINAALPADLAATVQEHTAAGQLHANENIRNIKKRKSRTVTPDHSTDTPSAATKGSATPKKPRTLAFDEASVQKAKEDEATTDSEKKGSSTKNALEATSEEDASDSSVGEMP
ncbi:hypothetical protein FRACYDRAFT_249701 [Fragilariopsis cylindrus CCMP1102]|uniref:Uncharacterized protein n=1 Tax=Fragilariopsis cylindrus CCMP1102 TaxID=635003 RepID=A0A1E7EQY6_9STRA|nr:hypothetical protein FRACYDRAFT_249701 [Fragilariopsis cylindrus CCMP1102]|eukprot:OEU08430.1 hypothetical protein FRACYDRAFT_249701 [Fragilariopsis cylindrus CCMP1102]